MMRATLYIAGLFQASKLFLLSQVLGRADPHQTDGTAWPVRPSGRCRSRGSTLALLASVPDDRILRAWWLNSWGCALIEVHQTIPVKKSWIGVRSHSGWAPYHGTAIS
jgi:hypothetical protein